jgi:hypothetical protein
MDFYRFELFRYAEQGNAKLELNTYQLIKETQKGYWIGYLNDYGYQIGDWQKWVSKTSKKRFAYPTKELALTNFIKRTQRRILIMKSILQDCEYTLNLANLKEKSNGTGSS